MAPMVGSFLGAMSQRASKRANFDREWEEEKTLHPVGSLPVGDSPYGVKDLSGNAREWVQDWYDAEYYQYAPDRNPQGPEKKGVVRSIRGGSWHSPIFGHHDDSARARRIRAADPWDRLSLCTGSRGPDPAEVDDRHGEAMRLDDRSIETEAGFFSLTRWAPLPHGVSR